MSQVQFLEKLEFSASHNFKGVKGRLAKHYDFWVKIGANDFVLDTIKNGYVIPFLVPPPSMHMKNNKSAVTNSEFVEKAVLELVDSGCAYEVPFTPYIVNPLSVASNKSGKKRLILDLSILNKSVKKERFKFEDWKTAIQFFKKGSYLFKFDLKSGYHHYDICPQQQTFLGFSWNNKYYCFSVLVFGLASSPYLFTKCLRSMVKYWRQNSIDIVLYLDDGFGMASDYELCRKDSDFVKKSLEEAGFLVNVEKSVFEPTQKLEWLGITWDSAQFCISIPERRLNDLLQSIDEILDRFLFFSARQLAQVTGKIISLSPVLDASNVACGAVTHFSEVFKTRRWNDIDSFRQSQSPAMQLLVDQIPSFCLSSRAANTQRQYRYVFNAFCKWCLSINFSNTLPASVISVASYLVYLTNIGKSTSSINEAFYAISWAHRLAGVENPCKSDLVISVKEGSLRSVGHIVVKKEPITPEILYQIVMLYGNDKSNLKDVRIACMCLISFAGFLRYSELANLTRNNIVFHDSYISLLIESSKTDIYREGRDVLISKTDKITCPVKMLMKYLDLANIKSDSNDLIFRPLSFCKSVNGYKLRNGKLSYTTARDILLSTLTSIGLDKKYFGLHSLRSGGATAAANAHVEDRIFKKHGRWKSDRAKDGYVKENISERLTVTKNLGI
ncbi:uncharacterized protein [Mytilus edulis]|uniref:uncharacterized protein isoform X2 n=1 Tax=Mytilus edulis TaxID=6550 RepID=UPI0039F0BB23